MTLRWNSPYINHFIQPDTIIPDQTSPESWDRYSYVQNNPLRYTDPSGHRTCESYKGSDSCFSEKQITSLIITEREARKHKTTEQKGSVVSGFPTSSCSGTGCGLVSSFPSGSGCTYTNYCYIPPEEPEPAPGWPDYYTLEAGVPVLAIVGVEVALTVDKYKRIYFGIGPSVGTSPVGGLDVNVSLSGGYIQDANTTPEEATAFISKWSGNACGGFVVGLCGSNGNLLGGGLLNKKDWAVQVGAFTPQAGVALPYSWQVFP